MAEAGSLRMANQAEGSRANLVSHLAVSGNRRPLKDIRIFIAPYAIRGGVSTKDIHIFLFLLLSSCIGKPNSIKAEHRNGN